MLFNTLLFASTASATCLHGLSMFKRAEGESVKINTFGYGPLNGPLNWASLEAENEACKAGSNQSPINLDNSVTTVTQKPVLNIPEVEEVEFENLGTTIEVVTNGTTSIGGTDFRLVQFHMHTPSEHHVNGEYHPLEVHMVHEAVADNTKLAVLALMFQVSAGESSSIIKSLSSSVSAISTPGTKTAIRGGIDFSDVVAKVASSDVLQYTGSLTTPPCAEGVTFMIVKDPLDISVADFNSIKGVVKFNARFIQNSLGSPNMLEVANRAGTTTAFKPAAVEQPATSNKTANATVEAEAAPMSKGHTFTVTELHGKPTQIAAVVVKKRTPKYS
ncbi:carbonic anhydrase [Cucurbitaria berberidis CBS 394.84]|uniref:Carbonic anhydrase n=1 Tax=Cucurbitaria berberidis CBS 394.84 TaxID=1168544 RepID=A0A9P4L4C8_9PLEO|nr:carbonic anhydrase [Cucurbitaria berberidis CBS 394.84]KAF1841866.1 carbonic anhydrase [Cucurbitaria berberidis CBS 394.84]